MKKTLLLLLTGLTFSLCADEEPIETHHPVCAVNYIRLGAGSVDPSSEGRIGPSLHLGRRYETEENAVDISVNWVRPSKDRMYISAPKVMYLSFLTPHCDRSFYWGAGLSLGFLRVDDVEEKKFDGLYAEGSIGYELLRRSNMRAGVQVDVSQGLLAFDEHGSYPSPVVECSLGIGF